MVVRISAVVLALACAAGTAALACTGIRITAKDGAVIVSRTLEFGMDLQSKVVVIPAGTKLTGSLPNGATGIAYTTKYGVIGANAFGLPVVIDGLNDQGLYVGEFFFPGYAGYTGVTPANASQAMAGYQYSEWILGNFATVAELKAAYDRVVLAPTQLAQMGMAPPVHFRVVDKTGAAVVIEPVAGRLRIYDDPIGVLTNAPTFDWHLTNLNNYVGLSPMIRHPLDLSGYQVSGFGQGSGFYGLPGDFTPPSRFVRAVAYEESAVPSATAADAVAQSFHILNNFDIPVGAVRDVVQGKTVDEYTLWTSVVDLQNLQFYFRTFDDQTLRSVDVRKALAAANGQIQQLPMESGRPTPIEPVTY
ncbi:MAG TPA: choloylglycine hydrolase family protein [Candidatus Tumulicola sp.]